VSRQWYEGIVILRSLAASRRLPSAVVVGLNTNGPISAALFDQMMDVLRRVRRVVFVTVKEPRFWQDENNQIIRAGVARWPNARVADWYALSWKAFPSTSASRQRVRGCARTRLPWLRRPTRVANFRPHMRGD
jgi:hypothetical protein